MSNQYFATNRKVGDGTTTVWSFSFEGARPDNQNGTAPYLAPGDVKAALVTYTSTGVEQRTPLTATLTGPSQLQITPAVPAGVDFVIYRDTQSDVPVADFTDFASISERDLDDSFRQTLFVVQESLDGVQDAVNAAADSLNVAGQALNASAAATDTANAASTAANSAVSIAVSAASTAAAAEDKADAAVLTADAADAKADAATAVAQGTAEDTALALSTAIGADTRADEALVDSAQALSTANTALSNSSTALSTANSASAAASSAVSTANAAASDASTALSTANTALTTANEAKDESAQVSAFREDLDTLADRVEELTGLDPTGIMLYADNLQFLTDIGQARFNLGVHSAAYTEELANNVQLNLDQVETDLTALIGTKANSSTTITAGNGLTGGGSLAANRTITLGTPGTISGTTTNAVTGESHTHVVSSTDSRTSTSTAALLQAKAMNDHRTSGDHDGRYVNKSGDTMTGQLLPAAPTVVTALTSLNSGTAPINFGSVGVSSTGVQYAPMLHGMCRLSPGGYRQHVSIGHKRPGGTRWGEFYIGVGGNDSYPTREWLFDGGSGLLTSPGGFAGNGSALTALNASNISTGTIADARLPSTAVRTSRTITAGNGLSGGGNLGANRTITLGTPGSITATSTNSVTATSHTHAITEGTIRSLISQGAAGAVGTYALAYRASTSGVSFNATYAGSNLRATDADGIIRTPSLAGTWRAMGSSTDNANDRRRVTVFLRIS